MKFCTLSDIQEHVLAGYLNACEEQNPGIAERSIEAVSSEIQDMLARRYPLPWPSVPPLIREIAGIMSAYRTVSSLTSLVNTEGATDNDWLPLQSKWKRATGMLEKLAKGELYLPFEEKNPEREDAAIAVITPPPLFTFKGF